MKRTIYLFFALFTLVCFASCGDENNDNKIPDKDKDTPFTPDNVYISVPPVFVHPGILHTREDLLNLKIVANDASHPGNRSYQLFKADLHSSADYVMKGPYEEIYRGSSDGKPVIQSNYESDFNAAYQNAIMWVVTDDETHALKAAQIVKAYASKLKRISGEAALLAGIMGTKFVYAAEVIISTYPQGFTDGEIQQVKDMFANCFVPVLDQFIATKAYSNGNWGASIGMAKTAMSIFLDDKDGYRQAIEFFLKGNDNGTLRNYIDIETGQCQESGRDQAHTQLGLACLSVTCEMAYKHGLDLYKVDGNRLLKGFEYSAAYHLGNEVEFKTWTDVTGKYCKWTAISSEGRGTLRPVWYMVYNHYVNRCGIEMPFTSRLLKNHSINPEGYYYEHFGFGQFLFNSESK